MLHAEVLLLLPFLRTAVGGSLALFSILVASARVVQGMFGFDHIFVATNLLLRNLSGFPLVYSGLLALTLLLVVLVLGLSYWKLPVREFSLSLPVVVFLILSMVGLKLTEDVTRKNLVGTSFGYFGGQMVFANMFSDAYRTPGEHPSEFPGSTGARLALAGKSNYWLVVVESMGQPIDADLSAQLFEAFRSPAVLNAYRVSTGTVSSRGSTIHGELRELCNGTLVDGLFGSRNDHCLPRLLAGQGYGTHAVHANTSTVYGRDVWYPKIGFEHVHASDTEVSLRGERSSSRWGSLQDAQTISWATQSLFGSYPSFVYLLTVSTHLPAQLLPEAKLDPVCMNKTTPQVCTHVANLASVMQNIALESVKLPNTVVVVVGDHAPPFVSVGSRAAFESIDVPYVVLTPLSP